MKENDINEILAILKKEVATLKTPALGVIAETSHDPFLVLIACILSLRTRDEVTATSSARLFNIADKPDRILRLSEEQIANAIYPASFYRKKAKSILEIAQILEEKFSGQVPDDLKSLLSFPGVGLKTANLVLSVAFKKPAICVDIHVHRISNRIGYIKTKNPDESELALREKLPKAHWMTYNDILVPFGQFVCTPVSPFCSRCPIDQFCQKVAVLKHR